MSPARLLGIAAASLEPRIMSVRKHWPVAILAAGLVLTVMWIALVSWIPMHIISSLVAAYLGDIVRSFL